MKRQPLTPREHVRNPRRSRRGGCQINQARSNNNVAYRYNHYVVHCSKYRRRIVAGEAENQTQKTAHEVCYERNVHIIVLETMLNHLYLLVSVDPQYGIHRLATLTKGRSSRLLWKETPSVKQYVESQQKG